MQKKEMKVITICKQMNGLIIMKECNNYYYIVCQTFLYTIVTTHS